MRLSVRPRPQWATFGRRRWYFDVFKFVTYGIRPAAAGARIERTDARRYTYSDPMLFRPRVRIAHRAAGTYMSGLIIATRTPARTAGEAYASAEARAYLISTVLLSIAMVFNVDCAP